MHSTFQKEQELLLPPVSGKLISSIKLGDTPNTRDTLIVIMNGIALLSNTHNVLKLKRWDLIKPELIPPYNRLCKDEIKPTSKLFGDDPSGHLKDKVELKRAAIEMQKSSSTSTSS